MSLHGPRLPNIDADGSSFFVHRSRAQVKAALQLTNVTFIEYPDEPMSSSESSRTDKERVLQVLLQEYTSLKTEQGARIAFRDNLLYTTIGAVGAIASVALGGFSGGSGPIRHAFLLVPWVTAILGWTYLANDEKITSIRKYIDESLANRIEEVIGGDHKNYAFGWEHFHRDDKRRDERKGVQLAIDLWAFVISGFGAVAAFFVRAMHDLPKGNLLYFDIVAGIADLIVLAVLATQFIAYSKRARQDDPKTSTKAEDLRPT